MRGILESVLSVAGLHARNTLGRVVVVMCIVYRSNKLNVRNVDPFSVQNAGMRARSAGAACAPITCTHAQSVEGMFVRNIPSRVTTVVRHSAKILITSGSVQYAEASCVTHVSLHVKDAESRFALNTTGSAQIAVVQSVRIVLE